MSKLLSQCPCCNGTLNITSLQCPDCGVELKNKFELSAFDRLSEEQYGFLVSFLKYRGNLKGLQEEMNISYPTAKKRLEELLVSLEIDQEETKPTEQEFVDMTRIYVDRESEKASEIVKAKLLDNGGRVTVHTATGLPCQVWMNPDGRTFSSDKLPIKPAFEYRVFDAITDLLISQGGRARKGNGRFYKLGESQCDHTTVVGAVAIQRGAKPGDSVYDPVFVLAAILQWAGIANNERGELVMIENEENGMKPVKRIEMTKIATSDLCEYIQSIKEGAKNNGKEFVVLKSGDIHRIMGLKNRMPLVCNAMRKCMGNSDVVLYETPSGMSSTLEIKYFL